MSEIEEKVKRNLEAILTYAEISTMEKVQSILSIKELAIVDREAELPEPHMHPPEMVLIKFIQDLKKEGWVKEILDD